MPARKLREADTTKTRLQMIAVADELIAANGLSATSVSAVARALGMSHANVYRHFKSRDALLAAVAQNWMADMQTACETAVSDHKAVDQNLADLVMAIRSQLLKRTTNLAALDLYEFVLRALPDDAKAHHHHRFTLVSRIIGDADQSGAVLDGLRGFTDPHLVIATQSPDITKRVSTLCRLLCRSL